MAVFCLSVHAEYLCAHAGACCTAGWPIPIEDALVAPLTTRFGSRYGSPAALFRSAADVPGGMPALAGFHEDGACIFFEKNGGRLCAIHREGGPDLLPSACRHFPRVVLRDPRGTFVSLSHFCPTAAALLVAPRALQIVEAPASLALDGHLEGLDATRVLPPLLRPGLLTDHEGYAAWERHAIHALGADLPSETALGVIAGATEWVRTWTPGAGTLAERVARAFAATSHENASDDLAPDPRLMQFALDAVPAPFRLKAEATQASVAFRAPQWRDVEHLWPSAAAAARRYLAARLFGNWIAYQGQGLRTVVESLRVSLVVLKLQFARHGGSFVDAVQAADLLLVHLADGGTLAARLSGIEAVRPLTSPLARR